MALRIESIIGPRLGDLLPELASLRMQVFREWPYLYDGTLEYEEEYLQPFLRSPQAICVVAWDGEQLVGASTGSPLSGQDPEFSNPFQGSSYPIERVFYLGESVLLSDYRGQGLGHAFFDGREAHARRLSGFEWSAFCAVVRPREHPLRPAHYRPLDAFWQKRGYAPDPTLVAQYRWRDLDQQAESDHPMQFWLRRL